jgi:hypothetical protein
MGIGHVADISGSAETGRAGRDELPRPSGAQVSRALAPTGGQVGASPWHAPCFVGWHLRREGLMIARLLYWLGGPFGQVILWLLLGLLLLGVIRF